MTDPFTDVADELMTRSSDLGSADAPAPAPPSNGARTKKHVCPYCGAVTAVVEKPTGPCPRCNMEDTPATRAATKARIGPWYVLQTRNPSAPGMKWATLLSLVSKGQVTPRSVLRGPTTHQLWKFAAHVKGLSREFNLCYSCGGEIERTANQCPHCDRLQEPPVNPDSLLESRELGPRAPIQRELKAPAPSTTDLVLANSQPEQLARPRTPEDGILSAKELAAAFQLDFNPQTPATIAPSSPRGKRRGGRILVALFLLAAIAGAGVLVARPDYREKTVAWFNSTFASVKSSISPAKPEPKSMPWDNTTAQKPDDQNSTPAGSVQDPTPAPEPPQDATPTPAPTPAPVADQNTAPSPAPTPSPEPTPAPLEVAKAPSPGPEVITPPPTPTPTPAPAPTPTPTPAPSVSTEKPAPAIARELQDQERIKADLDATIPVDRDSQQELSQKLWNDAYRAQQLNDFPLAVKCFEKLKTVPASARQSDKLIDRELEIVRRQLP